MDEDNPSDEKNSEEEEIQEKIVIFQPSNLEDQLKLRKKLWKIYTRKPKHEEKNV